MVGGDCTCRSPDKVELWLHLRLAERGRNGAGYWYLCLQSGRTIAWHLLTSQSRKTVFNVRVADVAVLSPPCANGTSSNRCGTRIWLPQPSMAVQSKTSRVDVNVVTARGGAEQGKYLQERPHCEYALSRARDLRSRAI